MSEGDSKAQRKHKRVATREVTASVAVEAGVLSYVVANLSIGGALVTGSPPLAQGEVFALELKLKGTRAVVVRGKVVHARPEGMGIAFETLASADLAATEKLIAAVEASAVSPPPLPQKTRSQDDLPPVGARPDEGGLFDMKDPRPPRTGAPDEREDYLRALVKNRDEAIRRARLALGTLVVEADGLRAAAARFKQRLDTANQQHALTEVALTTARQELERQRDAQLKEREVASDLLEMEQRRTLEAIGAVSGLEARLRRHEVESARALEEAEAAKREAQSNAADSAALRKAREELLAANRKAMEAQAGLKRERDANFAAQSSLSAATAEVEQLKAEVSKLKAKLIGAENALERAASRKVAVKRP